MSRYLYRSALASILASTVLAAPAAASSPYGASPVEPDEPARSFDFEGDEIEGERIRPDSIALTARRFGTFDSLIRVRSNFVDRIVLAAEDL